MLDLIDGPVVVVVDDFADQVGPVADIAGIVEKPDVVFLCAERAYRGRYVRRSLAGCNSTELLPNDLSSREAKQLLQTYTAAGLVGDSGATNYPDQFAKRIEGEPIAVACCRILNDFKPMDRIVASLMGEANTIDRNRYVAAALAQFCINGGIRYDILVAVAGAHGLREQIDPYHPVPLAYSEEYHRNYLVPLNGVIGSRVLESVAKLDNKLLFDTFVRIAKSLAPRVNRATIKRRSPEARLAGRLFDFDQVVEHFLPDKADDFYNDVQIEWQWNSRYWEQVALLNLGKYHKNPGVDGYKYLEAASQHARHAVSVERHPFPLTTLAKVLLAEYQADDHKRRTVFDEAFARLADAIDMERKWNWKNSHAYTVVFRGVLDFLYAGGQLSSQQAEEITRYSAYARRRFARDRELQELRLEMESLRTA